MSQLAIRATGLSKQYRLGATTRRHNTLRDELAFGFKRIFRRNGRLRSGSDRIWALKDVSFDIKEGEALGIIGLNGAGKSTLLKLLSRITEPTEGRGEVYGRLGALLEVGTGFHYELTGRENVYLSGAILGMRKAEIDQKFDAIVDFAELERFIDTPVKHYSSGMFVRLAFAVAAHLDPDILLVDEVLSVGDLGFQRKCTDYMLRLRERDATVIVVSHNMFAVRTLCDRAIYLAQGRVASTAPRRRRSRFTSERVAWARRPGPTRFSVGAPQGPRSGSPTSSYSTRAASRAPSLIMASGSGSASSSTRPSGSCTRTST